MKKEIIKNVVKTSLILLLAIVSTYYIYHKYQSEIPVDSESNAIEISYHDADANKIKITKVTPVTDSVGLSSNSYTITVKNNLTMDVNYKVKIVPDADKIIEDECREYLIPEEDIRISVKSGKSTNQIYTLNELEDGILLLDEIKALDTEDIVIRTWIKRDSNLTPGSKMHYHGIIQVSEDTEERISE